MFEIEFEGVPTRIQMEAFTDECIDIARNEAERIMGCSLAVDCRTDFPSFTVYEDGEEIAGG